jgi:hypothetical protein
MLHNPQDRLIDIWTWILNSGEYSIPEVTEAAFDSWSRHFHCSTFRYSALGMLAAWASYMTPISYNLMHPQSRQ